MSDDRPTPPFLGRTRRAPPARPTLRSDVPSPLPYFEQPRPPVVTFSAGLWILSSLTAASIVAYFALRFGAVHASLETAVREEDPGVSESTLRGAVNTTLAVGLGLIALSAVLKLLLALLMAARRNWARVLLAIVGVVALPLTVVAVTLLTVDTLLDRTWLVAVVGANEVLMLAGVLTMFLPRPNSWFRLRPRLR